MPHVYSACEASTQAASREVLASTQAASKEVCACCAAAPLGWYESARVTSSLSAFIWRWQSSCIALAAATTSLLHLSAREFGGELPWRHSRRSLCFLTAEISAVSSPCRHSRRSARLLTSAISESLSYPCSRSLFREPLASPLLYSCYWSALACCPCTSFRSCRTSECRNCRAFWNAAFQ